MGRLWNPIINLKCLGVRRRRQLDVAAVSPSRTSGVVIVR
jgi:hypothetical protein